MVDRVLCRADWKLESTEDPRDIESVKGLRGIVYVSIWFTQAKAAGTSTQNPPPRSLQSKKTRNVTLPSLTFGIQELFTNTKRIRIRIWQLIRIRFLFVAKNWILILIRIRSTNFVTNS